ncbi:ABC transporter substrate-binding protein [Lysinibacter cavernae]|uniref:Raffinose/stachyose/melibiose transport system substrate-binding protein n=1 Tax=Lysinibacter cavernae TaxID=1640652 RepID=A0A7X5QYU4_9MICO|nr:extracellular solute-binding protein [Lysinibacter cavernae]NIH52486.1 raffinose/stachyose/melibiose transport system substrate-binding protein [Lysinibacter cavernae]
MSSHISADRFRVSRTTGKKLGAGALGVVLATSLAACSAPGASSGGSDTSTFTKITAPVTADEVSKLGDITLNVWADQGEEDTLKLLEPLYEKEFSNVDVKIQYKSYEDLTQTVVNAMNSDSAPDVTQGNQGYATDGTLVKAGLIRPLDDVAEVYGYADAVGDAISQLQWSDDGKVFGSGTTYGMSPDNQMVGVFYNKKILSGLGITPPTTFTEFEAALAAVKASGEQPITFGNADKTTAMQAFSVVQGAMTPASDTVAWITGQKGSDFNNDTNAAALDTWTKWVSDGYLSPGYDGTSPDDAANAFAAGTGAFYIGGNWHAGTISDSDTFGFVAAPVGESGTTASSGSFGLPWHIGSKSKNEKAAIAFVAMINSADFAQNLADVNRVPVQTKNVTAPTPLFSDLTVASDEQLSNNGSLYWYDWATDTMYDTFTSGLQEVMAGRTSSPDFLTTVQKNWTTFQDKR